MSGRRRSLLIVLVALVACGIGYATIVQTIMRVKGNARLDVYGEVLDVDTGRPISDVKLGIRVTEKGFAIPTQNTVRVHEFVITTDAGGQFRVHDVVGYKVTVFNVQFKGYSLVGTPTQTIGALGLRIGGDPEMPQGPSQKVKLFVKRTS